MVDSHYDAEDDNEDDSLNANEVHNKSEGEEYKSSNEG